jgi:hypothetical protein
VMATMQCEADAACRIEDRGSYKNALDKEKSCQRLSSITRSLHTVGPGLTRHHTIQTYNVQTSQGEITVRRGV